LLAHAMMVPPRCAMVTFTISGSTALKLLSVRVIELR
jgi:hypothetical protein